MTVIIRKQGPDGEELIRYAADSVPKCDWIELDTGDGAATYTVQSTTWLPLRGEVLIIVR